MPFKLNQDRRRHIFKQKHKVTNWRAYDASLRQRGSLTVWFTDEAVEGWPVASRPGVAPARVTTDGQDSHPRAIRNQPGRAVRHRTSRTLNNRLEQDHRGLNGRCQPMRGFKRPGSAARFCRGHDELRNLLRVRSRHDQRVPALSRRLLHLRRTVTVLATLEAA